MKKMVMLTTMVVVTFLLAASASAEVPKLINYQGLLVDDTGIPVNDTFSIRYAIYDAESGGNLLWQETQEVQTQNGIYNVLLGSVTEIPDGLFDEPNRYLGVTIGIDPEMAPRQQFTSVPYAFNAGSPSSGEPGVGTEIHVNIWRMAFRTTENVYWYGNRDWTPIDISSYVPDDATAVYVTIDFGTRRNAPGSSTLWAEVRNGERSPMSSRSIYEGANGGCNNMSTWIPLGAKHELNWRVQWSEISNDSIGWGLSIIVNGYMK